jgi:hypothetical protein
MSYEIKPDLRDVLAIEGVNSIAVGDTDTAYSYTVEIPKNADFGYEITASGTTIDLKVELEQGNSLPTTEGSADTVNYALPEGSSALISNLTTSAVHLGALSPVVSRYMRFKITGQGSNSSNVTVTELKVVYAYNN